LVDKPCYCVIVRELQFCECQQHSYIMALITYDYVLLYIDIELT